MIVKWSESNNNNNNNSNNNYQQQQLAPPRSFSLRPPFARSKGKKKIT